MEAVDLSSDRMGEEREAPLPQFPMEIGDPTGPLEDEMDQKENLCKVQEDKLGTLMKKKRNRKGGGFNLRKSLAWNQAFFTEEGVLAPSELSLLNRSSTKSKGNLPSVSEMSPLTVYGKSSIRPPLHDLATKSRSKDSKPRKLFSSSNEESEPHETSGNMSSAKGVLRSIPRSPATYSQKRFANPSTTNPTSKLPKFMPTKPHVPSMSSTNVMLTTKKSKSDQSAVKANVGQNTGLRLPHTKLDSACSSLSSNLFAGDHGKNMIESRVASLKATPNQSSSTKHETVTCVPGKVVSSFPQGINHVSGCPPAAVHARPSALRMPSPSLGFFCQGKVSPSYSNQHQIHTQPSESKIPSLRQPMNRRQNCQLWPLSTSARQQPMKATAAANSGPASVILSSSQACLAANCLKPPSTPSTYLHVQTNSEMKQADSIGRRASIKFESSYCLKDSREQPGYDNLLAGQDTHKLPKVLPVQKPDSDRVKEVEYGDSSSNISNESSVKGIQQSPSTNVPENVYDACPPTEGSNGRNLSCSNESQACEELQECDSKEIQNNSWVDNLARHSPDKVDETYPVAIENKQSDGDSHLVSNLGSEFTPRSVSAAYSTEAKLSPKEETAGAGLNNSLELDPSLSPRSGICGQAARSGRVCFPNGVSSASSEKCDPMCLEEREDCRLHCDSADAISSRKPDLLMPRMGNGTSRQEILLNVVPFSDEWVAAAEALGEDILEKKSGPVQHSPPDKALPEPGPWSPVKKKAQDIGPFDCTKYSKNLTTSDTD